MGWLKKSWDASFKDPRYRVCLHVVFWIVMFFWGSEESLFIKISWRLHYSVTLVGIAYTLFLYYPLVYGIIPLIKKRKWLLATVCVLAYYVLAVIFRTYNIDLTVYAYNTGKHWYFEGQDFWKDLYQTQFRPLALSRVLFSSLMSILGTIYIPLSIKFIRWTFRANAEQAWLEQQNVRLQLALLKSQVNPHFFFNTLNNLQSYIVQNEQGKSVELLNRLADFMRTSLYECDKEWISFGQEFAMIENYIAIERVRFDEDVKIDIAISGGDPVFRIPPFIFLPLIENAFKYSSALPSKEVDIRLGLRHTEEEIAFHVTNKYALREPASREGGIGLQNVRKRLEHYFPGQFTLLTKGDGSVFDVTLQIRKT